MLINFEMKLFSWIRKELAQRLPNIKTLYGIATIAFGLLVWELLPSDWKTTKLAILSLVTFGCAVLALILDKDKKEIENLTKQIKNKLF